MAEQRKSDGMNGHPVGKVQRALEGQEAACLAVWENSVLLLGDHQFYPGYCVLWARHPVKELHHLSPLEYMGFMIELRQACAAIELAYQPWKINLASLGNQVQHLHVHLFPRHSDDSQRLEHPWVHADKFVAVTPAEQSAAVQRIQTALSNTQP